MFRAHDLTRSEDPRLERLQRAARGWRLGPVVGALGYDYGQYLTVAGLPGGLVAWTKHNPVAAVLGPDLAPRWGIRQAAVQHAYDAGRSVFLQLELSDHRPLQVSAYRLSDGRRDWCAEVGTTPTRYGDPLGTAFLPDADVLVLADAPGSRATLTRLAGGDGHARWTGPVRVDRGDYLGDLGGGVAVAGGRPAYQLASAAPPTGPAVTAFDEATGHPRWSWGSGRRVHVIGSDGGRLLLEEYADSGLRLLSLDRSGRVSWQRPAPKGAQDDPALRAGVLVLRTDSGLVGLDAATGRRTWRAAYPAVSRGAGQVFPYGFDLSAQPMLDARHLLLGGTQALLSVDLRNGRIRQLRLPRDGINTTYWPYQLAVTDTELVVVTNTGAVVVRLR